MTSTRPDPSAAVADDVACVAAGDGDGDGRHTLPLLSHLARVGTHAADDALAPSGLRPRHLVALGLLREHGPASQRSLVEALRLDPSNVVNLLNDLEERGLVTRRRDPQDRRRHIVEISERGTRDLCAAQRRLAHVEEALLAALSAAERATLHALLLRAVDGHRTGSADAEAACTACDGAGEPSAG